MAFRKQFHAGKTNLSAVLAAAVVAVSAANVWATPASFTAGDLVVTTYGNSTASTTGGALTPIILTEYSPLGGAAVLTDNTGVDGEYGSNSEGNVQLSGNGQYLTFDGYNATAAASGIQAGTDAYYGLSYTHGTPYSDSTVALAQSASSDVPRVAVLVNASEQVNATTNLNDIFNVENPRSLYSATGSTFYISGQSDGSANSEGIFTGTVGLNTVTSAGTPTPVDTAAATRFVTAYNGNLYYSADTSATGVTGIWEFNGLPTSAATPTTQIVPANNGKSGGSEVFYSPDGFYFANSTTLYVADTGQPKTGSASDGGIQKWTFNTSTSKWVLDYTLTPTLSTWVSSPNAGQNADETGFEAITGQVVGGTVDLYAVSYTLDGDDPDGLYSISDTLSATTNPGNESFTELETAAGDGGQIFKGVSFAPVPEPTTLALLGVGSLLMLRRRNRRNA